MPQFAIKVFLGNPNGNLLIQFIVQSLAKNYNYNNPCLFISLCELSRHGVFLKLPNYNTLEIQSYGNLSITEMIVQGLQK